jgi:hypothetical protein
VRGPLIGRALQSPFSERRGQTHPLWQHLGRSHTTAYACIDGVG